MPGILGDHARAVAAHVNRRGNLERARHRVRNLDKHLQSDAAFRSAKKRNVHERDPVQPNCSGELGGLDRHLPSRSWPPSIVLSAFFRWLRRLERLMGEAGIQV